MAMFLQRQTTQGPANADLLQDPVSMQINALTQQQIMSVGSLVRMSGDRANLVRQLSVPGSNQAKLNASLIEVDGEIAGERAKIDDIKQRIAELKKESPISTTAPTSVMVVPPPRSGMFGMTKDEFTGVFAFGLLFPLVIAFARVIWRRGTRPARLPVEESQRFSRLEQAVESVAIEVERIGESQRFQTKLMTDRDKTFVAPE
ncbi:MAG: hypothetical protein ABJE10_09370 [bacterium]